MKKQNSFARLITLGLAAATLAACGNGIVNLERGIRSNGQGSVNVTGAGAGNGQSISVAALQGRWSTESNVASFGRINCTLERLQVGGTVVTHVREMHASNDCSDPSPQRSATEYLITAYDAGTGAYLLKGTETGQEGIPLDFLGENQVSFAGLTYWRD